MSIVVVGGASLAARGIVDRTTNDVDVIARVEEISGELRLSRASPFPAAFAESVERVARDYQLPREWLNSVVDRQWDAGLPPHLMHDVLWKRYSTLSVGYVGRRALISLKLFAAVDQGEKSKHWQDLLVLHPSDKELDEAEAWVEDQDASEQFRDFLRQASERLRKILAERPSGT